MDKELEKTIDYLMDEMRERIKNTLREEKLQDCLNVVFSGDLCETKEKLYGCPGCGELYSFGKRCEKCYWIYGRHGWRRVGEYDG